MSLAPHVATKTRERNKLERLGRYISRTGVAEKRLAVTSTAIIDSRTSIT